MKQTSDLAAISPQRTATVRLADVGGFLRHTVLEACQRLAGAGLLSTRRHVGLIGPVVPAAVPYRLLLPDKKDPGLAREKPLSGAHGGRRFFPVSRGAGEGGAWL